MLGFLDLVQAGGDRIAAHLHFPGFAVSDRTVLLIGDADFVSGGEVVHRRADRAARCAEIVAPRIGTERLAHTEPPPGLGATDRLEIFFGEHAAHGEAAVAQRALGTDDHAAGLDPGHEVHHQPADPEHRQHARNALAGDVLHHLAHGVAAEQHRAMVVLHALGQRHRSRSVDLDHLIRGVHFGFDLAQQVIVHRGGGVGEEAHRRDAGRQIVARRHDPAQERCLPDPQRTAFLPFEFGQGIDDTLDVVLAEHRAVHHHTLHVRLAQHADQFVGADHSTDRHGNGADPADRREHQREARSIAEDEAHTRALADTPCQKAAGNFRREFVEFAVRDRVDDVVAILEHHCRGIAIGSRRRADQLRERLCRSRCVLPVRVSAHYASSSRWALPCRRPARSPRQSCNLRTDKTSV